MKMSDVFWTILTQTVIGGPKGKVTAPVSVSKHMEVLLSHAPKKC